MTRQELLKLHETMSLEARGLMDIKNQDYAGETSPFANLEAPEKLGICPALTGIIIRMLDKLKRLQNFTQNNTLAVKQESVKDTCLDIINYSILFDALATIRTLGPTGVILTDLDSTTHPNRRHALPDDPESDNPNTPQ